VGEWILEREGGESLEGHARLRKMDLILWHSTSRRFLGAFEVPG
jgi:hypothetical protein